MSNIVAEKAQKSFLMQIVDLSVRLFLITTVVVLLLSIVNYFTAPVITNNSKSVEIKAMQDSFKGAIFTDITDKISTARNPLVVSVSEAKTNNNLAGYCVKVSPKGYGGEIQMLCSIDNNGDILGIKIISASETPGIGTKVLADDFTSTYKGYKKDDEMKIISGATITSKGVFSGVTAATNAVLPLLAK